MAAGSVLFTLGKVILASTVAEKAVEQLARAITAMVNKPSPVHTAGPGDTLQAQIDGLQETLRQQDQKISTLASTLDGLGNALRPLILRSAVTFWMALASVIISIVALIIAIRL
jgi:hypothetical protein